ncbi:MAG: hypothetical protein K2M11_05925 [Paramuribaculum sp.]|nr:hypothetical protein [Paramuribaculum sp.]
MSLRRLLFAVISLAAVVTVSAKDDPKSRHIQAVLFSGDTITGYLHFNLKTRLKNMFSKSGSIIQYITVGEQPKGGETKRYSASEIKEYRFLEPTEGYPEGALVISENINSPVPFKPNHSVRGFVDVLDQRDSGSILWWQLWDSTGGQYSTRRLVPVIGVKFKGAKAAYALFVNGLNSSAYLFNYLKKIDPEFKKYLEDYYNKGKDANAHRKELKDNPSTILTLYEEYMKNNPPLNDPEENTLPKK